MLNITYMQKKENLTVNSFILISFSTYYLLGTIMPIFGQIISTYFYMTTVLLLYLLIFSRNYQNFNRYFMFLLPFLALTFLELLNVCFNKTDNIIYSIYYQLVNLIPAVICFYLLVNNKRKTIRWIIVISILAFFITSITSYNGLLTDQMASRWLATVNNTKDTHLVELNMKNIGGFDTVYFIVILFPMVISMFKQKFLKIYSFVPIGVAFGLYVIATQYAMANILFFLSVILLILPKKVNINISILFFIILIMLMLIFKSDLARLFENISLNTNSNTLAMRFKYVADTLNGVENTTDAGNRTDALMRSWNYFIENPIMGNWVTNDLKYGGHSFILDILAKFGVVGGGTLFLMYRQIYRKFYLPFKQEPYFGYMLWCFILSIILGIFNTTGSCLLITSFIAPIIGYILQHKNYISIQSRGEFIENTVGM